MAYQSIKHASPLMFTVHAVKLRLTLSVWYFEQVSEFFVSCIRIKERDKCIIFLGSLPCVRHLNFDTELGSLETWIRVFKVHIQRNKFFSLWISDFSWQRRIIQCSPYIPDDISDISSARDDCRYHNYASLLSLLSDTFYFPRLSSVHLQTPFYLEFVARWRWQPRTSIAPRHRTKGRKPIRLWSNKNIPAPSQSNVMEIFCVSAYSRTSVASVIYSLKIVLSPESNCLSSVPIDLVYLMMLNGSLSTFSP